MTPTATTSLGFRGGWASRIRATVPRAPRAKVPKNQRRTEAGCSSCTCRGAAGREDGFHGALHSRTFSLYTRLISNWGKYSQNNTDKLLFSPIRIVSFFFFLKKWESVFVLSTDKDSETGSQPCTAGRRVNRSISGQNVIILRTEASVLTQFDTVILHVKMFQKE